MPRAEAESFVTAAEGRTCIRLYRREDGTVLTRDCPVGLRAVRQRLVRAAAALAGLLLALVSGTGFAGRLKQLNIPGLRRPADTYSEWIEPGSTQPVSISLGMMACPTPIPILPDESNVDFTVESQESPLPEPTSQQLQEIADRLAR